ncbi:MAG: YlmC/YmxH family sporulation protein [Eubacteriales bacterium]|nr:YlmC/YmxH family sporulation protein [Eubacteriales bacterium]
MAELRFSELHCREVIDLCGGARLGEVSDLVIDPSCGQIRALVVPGQGGLLGIFSREDCVIPWSCIETLGEDYILVKFRR